MAGIDIQSIQDAKDAINEEKVAHSDFMRVHMNGEVFFVAVDDVASVVRPSIVTPVPMAPDHLIGVTNIRGQISCIIDAGKVLNLKKAVQAKTKQTRFLLLRHERMHLGIWVESVADLLSIPTKDVPEDKGEKHIKGHLNIAGEDIPVLRTNALLD